MHKVTLRERKGIGSCVMQRVVPPAMFAKICFQPFNVEPASDVLIFPAGRHVSIEEIEYQIEVALIIERQDWFRLHRHGEQPCPQFVTQLRGGHRAARKLAELRQHSGAHELAAR
ncbi:hypothetical protein WK27_25555 [Burkholderia vietnamiensis]|nr:hypothetical protein WK27_25555 [Burkholderia vietnamiensis]